MRYPKFLRWIEGSVYDVGCQCGHITLRLCLAKGASAILCPACKRALELPSFDGEEE